MVSLGMSRGPEGYFYTHECKECGKFCDTKLLRHERPYARSPKKSYPTPDSLYQHPNGTTYRYVFTAFTESDMAPMAVYMPTETTQEQVTRWVRPLEEFMAKFKKVKI